MIMQRLTMITVWYMFTTNLSFYIEPACVCVCVCRHLHTTVCSTGPIFPWINHKSHVKLLCLAKTLSIKYWSHFHSFSYDDDDDEDTCIVNSLANEVMSTLLCHETDLFGSRPRKLGCLVHIWSLINSGSRSRAVYWEPTQIDNLVSYKVQLGPTN